MKDPVREQVIKLLQGGQAHLTLDDVVKDFPQKLRGVKPEGAPHTAWQLLEHMRIAQWDILEFCRDASHVSARGTLAAMEPNRPHAITATSGRSFATFPAAVIVPIVNRREELLLLESQRRPGLWEPVNGAVEDGETLLEAALREVREEVGPDLQVRPLGVVHASTFGYDARVQRMISVVYLMAHEGGAAVPGDDMRGSRARSPLVGGLTPHSLRRTFASLLFAIGETPPYVMAQMGHTSANLTLSVYSREMFRRDGEPERLRAVVDGRSRIADEIPATRESAASGGLGDLHFLACS